MRYYLQFYYAGGSSTTDAVCVLAFGETRHLQTVTLRYSSLQQTPRTQLSHSLGLAVMASIAEARVLERGGWGTALPVQVSVKTLMKKL